MESKNEFEAFPRLANNLLHAANTWKVDDTWSSTLDEINEVCRSHKQVLEALQDCQKLIEMLINAIPTGIVRNAACDANIIATHNITAALGIKGEGVE